MSLIWQGLELQPADKRWSFWITSGRDDVPSTRIVNDLLPFRSGRIHRQGFADRRTVLVQGVIDEDDAPSYRTTSDVFKGLLDPSAATPGLLVDTIEDGSQRYISAIPRNIISSSEAPATKMVSIEFEALDPYWYSPYGVASLDSGLLMDGAFTLDQGSTIIVNPTSSAEDFFLTVPGTVDTERVKIVIKGPSVGPVGVEVIASPAIGFLHPALIALQQLFVDNYARTASVFGGAAQARPDMTIRDGNLHGEYIRFPKGDHSIRILGQPTEVHILFTPTWL